MSLYKRGKTYWADFSVNGQRYRQSLDTSDWREAQSRQKEQITQASQGKLAPSSQQFARVAFSEAADRYQTDRFTSSPAKRSHRARAVEAFAGPLRRHATDSHLGGFDSAVHRPAQGSRPEQPDDQHGG